MVQQYRSLFTSLTNSHALVFTSETYKFHSEWGPKSTCCSSPLSGSTKSSVSSLTKTKPSHLPPHYNRQTLLVSPVHYQTACRHVMKAKQGNVPRQFLGPLMLYAAFVSLPYILAPDVKKLQRLQNACLPISRVLARIPSISNFHQKCGSFAYF